MATFILKVVGAHPLYIDGNIVYPGNQIELEEHWLKNGVVKKMLRDGTAIIVKQPHKITSTQPLPEDSNSEGHSQESQKIDSDASNNSQVKPKAEGKPKAGSK